ncbi:hypothetical protein OESDEN_23620 [Oesophagostomum dentatum]|uniref:Uncharacterized protein n=1 Tax=Oesophagostomum dentatum TaxID=61180 RepID=A0A0B1S0N2_OESDE|nr:hypothetical protein OESDEN_23620 [Oesophagostomum dentatum]
MCSDKHYYQLCPDEFVSIKVGWGVDPSYHGGPVGAYLTGEPIYVYDHGTWYNYADHHCSYYYVAPYYYCH